MTFDYFTSCDFCERKRDCFQLLFDGRTICEDCYDEHVRPCPSCNDIVIDGEDGQPCVVCFAFSQPEQEAVSKEAVNG